MALVLVITNAGRAALRNADASGTRAVRIASVGVSAAALAANAATAALPGEIKRITTVSGAAVAADIIHLTVSDETMTTYTVRSFALYLDDGTLFAAYGQADPIIEKSAQALMVLTVDVTLADIAASQITFGNANFLMPPATVETRGLIELATVAEAKAGEDQARAVTPAAAKAAVRDWIGYDPANRAGDTFTGPLAIRHRDRNLGLMIAHSGTGYGFLQLGDAANPVTAQSWHLGSGGDASFALYQGIWGSGTLRMLVTSTAVAFNGAAMWHANNDGAGSGLDADLLDGLQGAQFVRSDTSTALSANVLLDFHNATWNRKLRLGGDGYTAGQIHASVIATDGSLHLDPAAGTSLYLGYYAGEAVHFGSGAGRIVATMSKAGALSAAAVDAPVMRRSGTNLVGFDNDGAGSGLDADLLDGLQGAQFVRSDVSSTLAPNVGVDFVNGTWAKALRLGGDGYTAAQTRASIVATDGSLHLDPAAGTSLYLGYYAGDAVHFGSGAGRIVATMSKAGALSAAAVDAPVMRRSGTNLVGFDNDGAGSGLDADLLDGQDGSWYGNIPARLGYFPANRAGDTFTGAIGIAGTLKVLSSPFPGSYLQLNDGVQGIRLATTGGVIIEAPGGASTTAALAVAGALSRGGFGVYDTGNDGAGSGLDADLLDGRDGEFYRRWANLLDVPGAFPPTGHSHGAADLAGAFAGSLAENGFTVLPNGLILQWMTGPMQAARTSAANYMQWPIAFPTACLQAFVSTQMQQAGDRGDSWFQLVGAPDQNGATIQRQASGTADDIVASAPRVFAIGH
jgi:hypothetical protein